MPRVKRKKNLFSHLATDSEDMRLASKILSAYNSKENGLSRKGKITYTLIGESGEILKTTLVDAETDLNGKAKSPETVRRRTERGARLLGIRHKTSK